MPRWIRIVIKWLVQGAVEDLQREREQKERVLRRP